MLFVSRTVVPYSPLVLTAQWFSLQKMSVMTMEMDKLAAAFLPSMGLPSFGVSSCVPKGYMLDAWLM
jgi:hypothetical protein